MNLNLTSVNQKLEQSSLSNTNGLYSYLLPEQKYIQTVLRYDLTQGVNALGRKLMTNVEDEILSTRNTVLILTVVFVLAEIVVCIVCALQHLSVYRKIGVQTFQLEILYESILDKGEQQSEEMKRNEIEQFDNKNMKQQESIQSQNLNYKPTRSLIPISFAKQPSSDSFNNLTVSTSASAKFQECMITGVNWVDEGRLHISDITHSLIESLQRGDDMKSMMRIFEILISSTRQYLNKEESLSQNIINQILKKYRPLKKGKQIKTQEKDDNIEESSYNTLKLEYKENINKLTTQEINNVMMQVSIFQAGFKLHRREHTVIYERLKYMQEKISIKMKEMEQTKVILPFGEKKKEQDENELILEIYRVILGQVISSLFQEHFIDKDQKLARALAILQSNIQ
ncbi:MAG: hypothetical protein EZS28_015595 [Streblomastix strix]|uniref:Transmembrane protein n=1 Tax=Streblomastix strix TaxID=222440 RepID=A0A5J4W1X3_9EUKA|nr:MAG: hypothetical protein EZS28_015595 [Streblomastix strix]